MEYLEKKKRMMKVMYVATILTAGAIGVMMLVAPDDFAKTMGFPHIEPLMGGVAASVFFAFALASVFGFRAPLKFCPVLLMQLTYKSVWLIAVILPLALTNKLPDYSLFMIGIFAVIVIGDLLSIPFRYLLDKTDVKG